MHAQVSENRMQFVDEKSVSNLTPIQKCFAPLLVISNVLNVLNTQFGFDFVVLNETQPLECLSMSVCQVYRMSLPCRIPLVSAWQKVNQGLFMLKICFVLTLFIDKSMKMLQYTQKSSFKNA